MKVFNELSLCFQKDVICESENDLNFSPCILCYLSYHILEKKLQLLPAALEIILRSCFSFGKIETFTRRFCCGKMRV